MTTVLWSCSAKGCRPLPGRSHKTIIKFNPQNKNVMKTNRKAFWRILMLLVLVMSLSCSTDDSGTNSTDPIDTDSDGVIDANDDCPNQSGPASNNGCPETATGLTFREIIEMGNDPEPFPQSETVTPGDTLNIDDENYNEIDEMGDTIPKRYICTTRKVDVTAGNDEYPLFDTNAEVIYPGALLQGATLNDVNPRPILVDRAGGTISYDINDGNANSSVFVDVVAKSSIQDAMNAIIDGGEVVPDNYVLEVMQVDSEKEMALELGLSIETFTTKVSSNLSFSTNQEFNRTLVKLTQKYYTMSFDLPNSPDDLFADSVTPDDLATYVQPNNPATFISSVVYGRIFYMLVESTSSRQDMDAKLNATYDGLTVGVEGEVKVNKFEELENVKIKVIAYGGSGSSKLTGETDIDRIAELLEETTDIRAGLPLSYTVRSVERPDIIVGTDISTDLEIVDCELKGILPPQGYSALVDLYEDDEDGEGLGAIVHISGSNTLIFNRLGTKYAWYNGGTGTIKGIFSITDEASPLGVVQLNDVGSGLKWTNDFRIYFFDKSGLSGTRFTYNANDPALQSSGDAPTTPIGTFLDPIDAPFEVNGGFGDQSDFPFVGQGFEAATRVGNSTVAFFGRPGEEYALYSTSTGDWQDVKKSDTWFNDEPNEAGSPKLFDQVGGVGRILFSASTERWLMVSEDGSEIMEYQGSPTTIRKFEGPWVVSN